jgi:hypothetical protein
MSQIQMQELKEWLSNPTALKFKIILANSRLKLLNDVSHNYIGRDHQFNKDIILSSLGGCEALEQVSNYLDARTEEELENLLKLFSGGVND